jgi:DNA-binding LytR/AlgR family response regulator
MKILIADDETPARGELRYILESLAPEAKICEAANGAETLDLIEAEPFDVVFLDIHMPGLDGLAVASMLMEGPEPPLIVFATAYDEHALRAFELAALDYVVKPFSEKRLAQTVERLQHAMAVLLEQRQEALRAYLRESAPQIRLTKLWGRRANENWALVDFKDILWIVAEDKKVFANSAAGEKLLLKQTLKELEPRLAAHKIVRVHKAYLVNLDYVSEAVPWFSGTYLLRMNDSARTQIPMSRGYAAQLKHLTEWH